ncbi:phosphotransferase [Cellulomonas chitinilytica]|uniref:Phosphotransferase n=1 Tax=Cellulomonas chitinilytica TaxID=398759 RepID=A0A919U0S4_9CELL|nr:aminoglycoside phosphotransferase family protein [Cellulomonas chitinilytica]GIG23210.1 phosphotransferase [Cellulomonas chitinilytica]
MTVAEQPLTTDDALRALVAPLGRMVSYEQLKGGMFATTYRVTLDDGTRVIAKTAPTETHRLLTYEHDLIRTEALVYRLAEGRDLLMPTVLLTDFSRTVLPSDVVVVTHLDGQPLVDVGFGEGDERSARAEFELGAFMARLHAVQGERFGYPNEANGLVGDTWAQAYGRMVEALLADAERTGTTFPADEIRAAVAANLHHLDAVEQPCLVHTDLWPGNLFVDPETGALVGIIDTERAIWADPLYDLVGAEAMSSGAVNPRLLAGYESVAGTPVDILSEGPATRLTMYRLSLTMIMITEINPREFEGDWLVEYRQTLWSNLRTFLGRLAQTAR